jgi:membrane protein DedA with SNARE-associated domain
VSALFLTIYLESFGVPLPGESGLIAAAFLAARRPHLMHIFLAAWIGDILEDSTGYLIVYFRGRKITIEAAKDRDR